MATKEKQNKRSSSSQKIKLSYIDSVLTGSESLSSVYSFCKSVGLKESTFYKYYNSFQALEDSIWNDWLNETLDTITNDPNYLEFSVREKLLSFYFTWFEILLGNRSFVSLSLKDYNSPESFLKKKALRSLKKGFQSFAESLVKEGEETGEIPKRTAMINKSYANGLWLQFLFLMNFWKNDNTIDFADTDAAIEKTVNLSLDFIGRGPLDTMIDFARFMYQRVN